MEKTTARRNAGLFLTALLLTVLTAGCLAGCSAGGNSGGAGPAAGEAIALLINDPTEAEREQYAPVDTLMLHNGEEGFIFVALWDDTYLNVVELLAAEDGSTAAGDTVYRLAAVPAGTALEIATLRSEGIPAYQLEVRVGEEGKAATYVIVYDGVNGTPKEETILAE